MSTSFVDADGTTRFRGTIVGGGPQPVMGTYSGPTTTITDAAIHNLSWGALVAGTALLDLTDPFNPLFLTPGCYGLALALSSTAPLTAGGHAAAYLNAIGDTVNAADSSHPDFSWGLAGTIVVDDVSLPLYVEVFNADGAASRDYVLNFGLVTKIA